MIQGNSGNNQFLSDNGDHIIQGNNDDGSGDDFLWAKSGKDFLIGEIEADECDCGKGFDIILNYDKCKEDTTSKNCEVFEEKFALNCSCYIYLLEFIYLLKYYLY